MEIKNENMAKEEKEETGKIETGKIVFMDFFAEWCAPCKMQDTIIEELKKKFGDKVEFRKIDVDKDGTLADKYKVCAIPTLIVEKDGKIFEKYIGITKLKTLENKIEEAMRPKEAIIKPKEAIIWTT